MPLNKLENFIKNAEGRILYVNPNDLDSTDGIENQGNSLTKPFKTIQRALIEAARFSYLKGNDNDFVERTTILLFPGEHVVDNRPGFGIKSEAGQARAVSPGGSTSGAINTLSLTLDSNFDLTQEDNILYKFNSVNGGVIIPRGTSIVGLDLRKTKVRPLYVPNPTDDSPQSAIFRITGACYFWQFTIFDGNELETVYTHPKNFSSTFKSIPTFSHHKLTCFEYADGVNRLEQYSELTDLDIYYSKLSNAYNKASANREITQKYPGAPKGFAPQRPEFEIVGAFATDPLNITSIESGDGFTPGQVVTVKTAVPHNLTGGTPIKIRGVEGAPDYNISTKVSSVINETTFTYLLPFVRGNLPAGQNGGLSASLAQVLVETDTVSGASPYIFNISMRSVYGMQGMHADGKKATGFRSMVVAQFTAVSLQKDDRAFVKYDKTNRRYSGIDFVPQFGEKLSSESSSLNPFTVYHLDQEANYRKNFRTTHIKVSNDAVVQIVSVFAIGFHSHFNMINGADASITNSNSNFGTFALAAEGFKKEAFEKDDKGFVTSIINPRSVITKEQDIEYLQLQINNTGGTATTQSKAYIFGYNNETLPPSHFAQGYRIGAKVNEKLYVNNQSGTQFSATIVMAKGATGSTTGTDFTSEKLYKGVHSIPTSAKKSVYKLRVNHELETGETVRLISDLGNLPENIEPHRVYYAITTSVNSSLAGDEIQLASSFANSQNGIFINSISNGEEFDIVSRVSDKKPNDAGHPIQYDATANQWFIHTSQTGNTINDGSIYNGADTANRDISYILRNEDNRGLDDKTYKLRYVVPKELTNGKDPSDGFVLQDSSSTNVSSNNDFTRNQISTDNFDFDRNTRFISNALFVSGSPAKAVIRTEKPHNLNVGDQVIVRNIKCDINQNGLDDKGFNGTFIVTDRDNSKEFRYSNVDVEGVAHSMGVFNNTTSIRDNQLPRVDRNDCKENIFIYRSTVITPYIENVQDGIYHLFVLNSNNQMADTSNEFDDKFNQNIVNLYPEYDRDNINDNPPEANSFANNFPIGDVVTNDLKKSITRETTNNFLSGFDVSNTISSISLNGAGTLATLTFDKEHDFESLKYITVTNGGSSHLPTSGQKTYYSVKLLNDNLTASNSNWDGATADVTVLNGVAIAATITDGGSGYKNGEQLYFDSADDVSGGIGGPADGYVVTTDVGISSATGNYVQITGISTGTDSYHRISSITSKNSISIHKETSDLILNGQQVVDMGSWSSVKQNSKIHDSVVGILTITSNATTNLLVGNKFRLLNASNESLGDFIVNSLTSTINSTTGQLEEEISATSPNDVTDPVYILKHGLSSHEAASGVGEENIGVRGMSVYDHDYLIVNENIDKSQTTIQILLPNGNAISQNITGRFPLGSYIQVNDEIMRVANKDLGAGQAIQVIRGVLGSRNRTHKQYSHLKKIKPLPIEFRRPSILRASGHTFEYVGYGPGNYSTALPQLQNRTLSEREEFLSQAQETSCGNVVYTGMNDKGDFYIGNTKTSSASGQQTTFDIPVPTITGEDPNRLSIVADEVIVKERLLVEGGSSKNILSQLDGPVTFNGPVRHNDDLTVIGITRLNNVLNSSTVNDGALVVKGGMGLAKDLRIGGNILPNVDATVSDIGSPTLRFKDVYGVNFHGDGANLTNTGAQLSTASGTSLKVVLTTEPSGSPMITAAIDNDTLTFNATSNTLSCTNFSGNFSGNSSTASLATDVVGAANRVLFNSSTNDTTTSANLTFNGTKLSGTGLEIHLEDGKKLTFGDPSNHDLEIVHDTGNSVIRETGTGLLYLQSDDSVYISKTNGTTMMAQFGGSGATRLYWTGSTNPGLRLETTETGVKTYGDLESTGDIIAFSSSDRNLKDNITVIPNALDKINAISGNTFTWKSPEYLDTDRFTSTGEADTGVIAQEIEALGLPGITTTRDDGSKAVRYDRLIPVLIQAVKELSAKVTALEGS